MHRYSFAPRARHRSRCASSTSDRGRRRPVWSSGTNRTGSIRRPANGSRQTLIFSRRSIAPMATSFASPPGATRSTCLGGPEYTTRTVTLDVGAAPATVNLALERWIDLPSRGWYSGDHHIHSAGCLALRDADAGRRAARHDSSHPRRGAERRLGSHVGTRLLLPETILRGARSPALDARQSDATTTSKSRASRRATPDTSCCCDSRTRTIRAPRRSRTGRRGTFRSSSGERRKAPSSDSRTPGGGCRSRATSCRPTRCRRLTASAPTSTSSTSRIDAVDFISTVDTPPLWELNIWYHTLNVGFRTRISGETDFPCIYGDRVGLGRSYVRLDRLSYEGWTEGIRDGRAYVTDGKSHLLDFRVNDRDVGTGGSELRLAQPGQVRVRALVAARLPEAPDETIRSKRGDEKPYWDLERARLDRTREVPVELVVNGSVVATRRIVADGSSSPLEFPLTVERSSWVALRILPSSHTNPIFVVVGDQPVRASTRQRRVVPQVSRSAVEPEDAADRGAGTRCRGRCVRARARCLPPASCRERAASGAVGCTTAFQRLTSSSSSRSCW